MKSIYKYILVGVFASSFSGCKPDLEVEPNLILQGELVWNDPTLAIGVLANYYDRLPIHTQLTVDANATTGLLGWPGAARYDEAIWSGSSDNTRNNIISYPFTDWQLWDYTLIRDINLALEDLSKSTQLTAVQKAQYTAELRFIRAYVYFEHVKRMGGVPIITSTLQYDFSGDPSPLRRPRNKESEVYDFIGSEVDAIKNELGNTGSNTRANKYTALALKSRAMLYAGSIAKYNAPYIGTLSLPNGEVGIPAEMAQGYYQKSLEASKEIINSGVYSLYKANTGNLGENFFEALTIKANNPEVIWAQDYLQAKGRVHNFAYNNIARSIREDNLASSSLAPTLNLVEDFEYLNGTSGELKGVGTGSNTAVGQQNWIFYTNLQDIFANKDARLYGTIMYPGTSFKARPLNIQAGVYVWNATTNKYDRFEGDLNSVYTDGKMLTGGGGPQRSAIDVTNTGFYVKKYMDTKTNTSSRGLGTDMWWVRFRLGEIYLNASEAAFELGLQSEALMYVNMIRERAGFGPNSLTTLTLERLQNERRVEMAFEDHRLWDLKRWRIAHILWNGVTGSPDATMYALYPYRIVRPGHPDDGKYVFDKIVAPRFQSPRFFQLGNYYSAIDQSIINNNPLIVRNPLH